MKKLLCLLVALSTLTLLTGCESEKEEIQTIDFEGKGLEGGHGVGVGESCAKTPCRSGLECDIDLICVDHVVDHNMVCPETHDPVCAYRDGRKNGYLNKCQALRHGAEVIHKGFCKNNEAVIGNCEAALVSIGNCNTLYEGYEFSEGACLKKKVAGCDAEIPFTSLEECESSCR